MIVDPRTHESRQYPRYAEDHCARGAILVLPFLPACALLLGCVIAALAGSVGGAVFTALMAVLLALLPAIALLLKLPLDIRIDDEGVRIGGIRFNERRPGLVRTRDAQLRGFTRALHVYACPWPGVRCAMVIDKRADLRLMRARSYTSSSLLGAPWWGALGRAAWAPGRLFGNAGQAHLVVEVETRRADAQWFRPPKGPSGSHRFQQIIESDTMVWVVPTRHPDALRAALRAVSPPIPEYDTGWRD